MIVQTHFASNNHFPRLTLPTPTNDVVTKTGCYFEFLASGKPNVQAKKPDARISNFQIFLHDRKFRNNIKIIEKILTKCNSLFVGILYSRVVLRSIVAWIVNFFVQHRKNVVTKKASSRRGLMMSLLCQSIWWIHEITILLIDGKHPSIPEEHSWTKFVCVFFSAAS